MQAVLTGDPQAVSSLCADGDHSADVDYSPSATGHRPPLHTAVAQGDVQVAKVLLSAVCGANVDLVDRGTGHSPLHMAVVGDRLPMVETLIQVLCSAHLSCSFRPDIYASLGKADANLNLRAKDGMSALYMAITRAADTKDTRCAEALLVAGADINLEDYKKLCEPGPLRLADLHFNQS